MLRRKVKISTLVLAVIFLLNSSLYVSADEGDAVYQYITRDGDVIDYYLDENGNPYNIIDGEFCHLALPLEHLEVLDPVLLEELNAALPNNELTRSAPTNYVVLSQGAGSVLTSTIYTASVDFSNSTCVTTSVLKLNTSHSRFLVQTTNISKPIWVTDPCVTLFFYYYDSIEDKWYTQYYIGENITTPTQIAWAGTTSEFVKFDVRQSAPINSCTFKAWTSGLW